MRATHAASAPDAESKPGNVSKVKVGNIVVRIYKRERALPSGNLRTVFEVADYTTGRRIMRSFSKAARAEEEAARIAKQLSAGHVEAAQMTNAEAQSFGRGTQLLRSTGASLEYACDVYAKAYELVGDAILDACRFFKLHRADQVQPRTVAEAIEELLVAKRKRGKSNDYVNDLRWRLGRFAEAHAAEIHTITTPDVQHFLDGLELSDQSCKNYRTVLHTLFEFAETRGYIHQGGNPVKRTEEIETNGGEIEIFTPEDIQKILDAARGDFRAMVAIGAFAGLRTSEIERLHWEDIDLADNFIQVTKKKAKTRSRRLVPIQPNLAAWLAEFKGHTGKVWRGQPSDLQETRAATCAAAGVQWKTNALRHSFISYRYAITQNENAVAAEAGNSPQMVFEHYRQLVKPAAAQAWFAIMPKPETPAEKATP